MNGTERRVAIITGGAGSIGAAIAAGLANEGRAVVIVDRPGADFSRAVDSGAARGHEFVTLECDTRDPGDVERTVAHIGETVGAIDTLVTAAGIGRVEPIERTDDDLWRDTIEVNLSGTFWWARACVPQMRESGRGVIAMISSTTALQGLPGRAAYAASKAGVLGLARTLAIELAGEGIRVIPVCPGATLTPLVRQGYESTDDPERAERDHARLQPIGRLSLPEEIAAAVVFACSDRAGTMTGAPLIVDGGYSSGGVSWNT